MKRLILSTIFLAGGVMAADPAEVLKEADRSFAALSAKEGPGHAFAAYAAQTVLVPNSAEPHITGQSFLTAFSPDTQIAWEPDEAQISAGGDLGFTLGHATITGKDKEGKPTTSRTRYVTIWRKQPDGSWKFVLDGGFPQP
jgi:ketosteroid isomerase-like protein